jgi:hypothetical protein
MANLFELLNDYNIKFPNAESPLGMMVPFGQQQTILWMQQSIEAGEPLEFESIEAGDGLLLDGMIVRIGDEIVS